MITAGCKSTLMAPMMTHSAEEVNSICLPAGLQHWCTTIERASELHVLYVEQ